MRVFPFAVYYAESNIFIGRAGSKVEQYGVFIPGLFDNFIGGSLRLVDKIRIEDIELGARLTHAMLTESL